MKSFSLYNEGKALVAKYAKDARYQSLAPDRKARFDDNFMDKDGIQYGNERWAERFLTRFGRDTNKIARDKKAEEIRKKFKALPSQRNYPGGEKGMRDFFRDTKKAVNKAFPGVFNDKQIFTIFVSDRETIIYKGKRYKITMGVDVMDMLVDIIA